jgi:hypothetical protein
VGGDADSARSSLLKAKIPENSAQIQEKETTGLMKNLGGCAATDAVRMPRRLGVLVYYARVMHDAGNNKSGDKPS